MSRHRGNAIVLVMACLALLVLIAAAFLTRTRSGRESALAQRDVRLADNNAELIARMIADEIAQSLFVQQIDPGDPAVAAGQAADPNVPRLAWNNAIRYGVDPNDADGNGLPDYPYNFAPYHVVPWTNWPDGDRLNPANPVNQLLPPGEGNPAQPVFVTPVPVQFEGNPVGNPGFGDSRWLADAEPLRWDTNGDGLGDRFSHWRKLTNLSRAGNGWRICRDISRVFLDQDGDGIHEYANVVTDLNIPVEQWLAVRPDTVTSFSEDAVLPTPTNPVDFGLRWDGWTASLDTFLANYYVPTRIPQNFYRLSDLDGDGVTLEADPGERFADTFRRGSARWHVGRILADSDGDGYTDAFWHVVPTNSERGIRQIVAVRIIDNSSMLNFNTATRFVRADDYVTPGLRRKTRGHTPADLALVGDVNDPDYFCGINLACNLRVGLFDNPANNEEFLGFTSPNFPPQYLPYGDVRVRWSPARWQEILATLGIYDPASGLDPGTMLAPVQERLMYWELAGRRPLDPGFGLTPFTLGDELELRMYNGNNHSKIQSRFETAVQNRVLQGNEQFENSPLNDWDLLHSDWDLRREVNEALDQLRNRELLFDLRHKLTAYSGARNDMLPLWLWWQWRLPPGYVGGTREAENFLDQQRRKLDLREHSPSVVFEPGEWTMPQRLPSMLVRALSQSFPDDATGDSNGVAQFGDSYFGPYDTVSPDGVNVPNPAFNEVRRLAAGFAANILAYRDADQDVLLEEAVPLPGVDDIPPDDTRRFLGMERQPFLVEVALAHVYEAEQAGDNHPFDGPGSPEVLVDDYVVCGDPDHQGTIVAVQIANPFAGQVDLAEYEIEVFGQVLNLQTIMTPNTLLNQGEQRTFLSMPADAIDQAGWMSLLNLNGIPANELIDVTGSLATDRGAYDSASADRAIELWRVLDPISNTRVLVDRIDIRPGLPDEPEEDNDGQDFDCDYRKFGRVVTDLDDSATLPPQVWDLGSSCSEEPPDQPWPGVLNIGSYTHWAQWVTASRPWELDFNGVPGIQPEEQNPRFVFALAKVRMNNYLGRPFEEAAPSTAWFAPLTTIADFSSKQKNLNRLPNQSCTEFVERLQFPMQMLQKDADFEQVGELLNVWLQGHEIETDTLGNYIRTLSTFSEFMALDPVLDRGANRLRVSPFEDEERGLLVGVAQPNPANSNLVNLDDPMLLVPDVPAGARVLDAFVCDGPGQIIDFDLDGTVGDQDDLDFWSTQAFRNANGFTGEMTPGLINVNTASREVLGAVPHWTRLVHEFNSPFFNPYVRVPDAIVRYRERIGFPFDDTDLLPGYADRGTVIKDLLGQWTVLTPFHKGLRNERGIASLGELMLLERAGKAGKRRPSPLAPGISYDAQAITDLIANSPDFADTRDVILYNSSFQMAFPALPERARFVSDGATALPPDTYLFPAGNVATSAQISTDVVDLGSANPFLGPATPDDVAEDAEEATALLRGAANMLTTRSDVFTVYFRVRSFRQNHVTGVWDATDPESIVEENRYVMLVDRSNVDRPSDSPRILYLERLPF